MTPQAQVDRRERTAGAARSRPPFENDVVYAFSHLSWEAAARRGWFGTEDRIAKALVGHERLRRVLICDRMRSLPVKLVRDRLSKRRAPFPADERASLLSPVRLRRTDPASQGGLRRTFRAYDRAMERAAERSGLKAPVVITTNLLLAGFAELSWARAVTFYAIDDWSAHPAYGRWAPAYHDSELMIRERGRRVAAVSDVLLERLAPTGAAAVVPNGVEPAEWQHLDPPHVAAGRRSRPRLLYAGTLDARLDVEWLTQLSRSMPEASLTLLGTVTDERHLARLRAEPNVTIQGPVARDVLVRTIAAADVGLVPHVRSALTEAMSPLKLYEYLAAGLPVAATDLRPMRGVDRRVVLVPEGGDFVAATREALALGRSSERQRCAFIEANAWSNRHNTLLDLALTA